MRSLWDTMGNRFRWAWVGFLAASLGPVSRVHAIQTSDVEIGRGGVYDGQVHISRDENGQMVFRDGVMRGPVPLSLLAGATTAALSVADADTVDHLHAADFLSSGTTLYDLGYSTPTWTMIRDKPTSFTATPHQHNYELPITQGTTGQYWRGDKTWQAFPAIPAAANPGATVDGAAKNGSAATFMRSDGASALADPLTPADGTQNIAGSIIATGAGGFANVESTNGYTQGGYGAVILTGTGTMTWVGREAGASQSGAYCTGMGYQALKSNTKNSATAVGYRALMSNSGNECTAIGREAGFGNTKDYCMFVGQESGSSNSGYGGSFFGHKAGFYNSGDSSCGFGLGALLLNSGSSCVGAGRNALYQNTGSYVIGIGQGAGQSNAYSHCLVIGYGGKATAQYQALIGTDNADGYYTSLYFGRGAQSASAGGADYTVRTTGGSGANKAAGNLCVAAGLNTGTGAGGVLKFQTSAGNGATSVALASVATRMQINADGEGLLGVATAAGYATNHLTDASGAYLTAGGVWTNASSASYKKNMTPLSGQSAWDLLDAVSPVEFEYKRQAPRYRLWDGRVVESLDGLTSTVAEAAGTTGTTRTLAGQDLVAEAFTVRTEEGSGEWHYGFVAEDLAAINGRLSRGGGVAAIDVAAFNTAAIKEGKRRVAQLEQRVAALEAQNAGLAAQMDELRERLKAVEERAVKP